MLEGGWTCTLRFISVRVLIGKPRSICLPNLPAVLNNSPFFSKMATLPVQSRRQKKRSRPFPRESLCQWYTAARRIRWAILSFLPSNMSVVAWVTRYVTCSSHVVRSVQRLEDRVWRCDETMTIGQFTREKLGDMRVVRSLDGGGPYGPATNRNGTLEKGLHTRLV